MFCAGLGNTGAKCIYIFVVFTSSGSTNRLTGPMGNHPMFKSVQQNSLHYVSGSVQPGCPGPLI